MNNTFNSAETYGYVCSNTPESVKEYYTYGKRVLLSKEQNGYEIFR